MAFSAVAAISAAVTAYNSYESRQDAKKAQAEARNAASERETSAAKAAQNVLLSKRARASNSLFTGAGASEATPTAAGGRTSLGV